jgi:hypothetical protein
VRHPHNSIGLSVRSRHLAEAHLALGELFVAEQSALESVTAADESGLAYWRFTVRTVLGATRHFLGNCSVAATAFAEAEQILADERTLRMPTLYSLWLYRYGEFLLLFQIDGVIERIRLLRARAGDRDLDLAKELLVQASRSTELAHYGRRKAELSALARQEI